jgi:carboxyl-terminal processing protease
MTVGGSPLISKSKYAALLLSSVLVAYAIVGGRFGASAQNSALPQLEVFSQVFGRIQNDYVDSPSMSLATTGAIRGMLERVDPYAGYLSPQDVAFYKDFNPEKTPGIGVVLAKAEGFPMILEAIPGGSAAKAGLKSLDAIEAIDGLATREMNLVQVYGYLANPPDKPAVLTVIGNNRMEAQIVTVPREVTKVPPVESRMIQNDIAYVRVQWLTQNRVNDVRKQMDDLIKKGATGVILDLRASAAGKETEGFALANLFVDTGMLGYKQGQKVPMQIFQADPKQVLTNSPLVVLVDSGTGGGAELAAAAILDAKRGKLVGMRTFGTGSIQSLIPLDGGYALLLSTAKYYSPSGKDIQADGVRPDTLSPATSTRMDTNSAESLEAPAPKANEKSIEEVQMEKAIEVLKGLRSAGRAA